MPTAKRTYVEVMIEIPRGERNKYEFDEERGFFRLDRVLFSSVHYPADYGFILDSLSDDGDHLDALVIMENPTFPGCVINARPIGVLEMRDEAGGDQKILSVPASDPRFRHITKLDQIGPHWLREIENFFATYKALEDKWTELAGWQDVDAAWRIIEEAEENRKRYLTARGLDGYKDQFFLTVPKVSNGTLVPYGFGTPRQIVPLVQGGTAEVPSKADPPNYIGEDPNTAPQPSIIE